MIIFIRIWYRIKTFISALISLFMMDKNTLNSFFSSYEIFEKDKISTHDDRSRVINYYRVLNYLCALGNVEKMYIPPIISKSMGIIDNQTLFEEQMMDQLKIKPRDTVLDIGCGRGRIAHHVAYRTGSHVIGINIDKSQIESAMNYTVLTNFMDKTSFMVANYNDKLPFTDNFFDAIYQVQAFTYAENVDNLFKEIYRVMKPGAKFSWLDWTILDNYDPNNEVHKKLIAGTKVVIGGVLTEPISFWLTAMKNAGFNIIKNEVPNVQYHLIESEVKYFTLFEKIISFLVKIYLLPKHFKFLLDRLNRYGEDFIAADKQRLCTTVYHIILEKPL